MVDVSLDKVTEKTGHQNIAPWASGDKLRKIEENVLIPNLMKKKAKVICKDYLDAFSACCNGRTISLAWSCRKEKEDMRKCLSFELDKIELFEECKAEYLSTRADFQNHYAETGEKKKQARKQAAF